MFPCLQGKGEGARGQGSGRGTARGTVTHLPRLASSLSPSLCRHAQQDFFFTHQTFPSVSAASVAGKEFEAGRKRGQDSVPGFYFCPSSNRVLRLSAPSIKRPFPSPAGLFFPPAPQACLQEGEGAGGGVEALQEFYFSSVPTGSFPSQLHTRAIPVIPFTVFITLLAFSPALSSLSVIFFTVPS